MLDMDLSDAQEPTVVPADEEYKLRVSGCNVGTDKNGNNYFMPRFECVDQPAAKDFTKFYGVPHSGMTAKRLNSAKWQIKELLLALGLDPAKPFDPENDLQGQECWAILGVSEDEQYGEQNYVKKLIRPK
jgi:hypothetical protein